MNQPIRIHFRHGTKKKDDADLEAQQKYLPIIHFFSSARLADQTIEGKCGAWVAKAHHKWEQKNEIVMISVNRALHEKEISECRSKDDKT